MNTYELEILLNNGEIIWEFVIADSLQEAKEEISIWYCDIQSINTLSIH